MGAEIKYDPFNGVDDTDAVVDALNASLAGANPPSAINAIATLADITGGGSSTIKSEFTNTSTTSAGIVGTGIAAFRTVAYPVDADVVPGTTRRIKAYCGYSKSLGVSSVGWRVQLGASITVNLTLAPMGNFAIGNGIIIFDILMNFRNAGVVEYLVQSKRYDTATAFEVRNFNGSGTWNAGISNNITLSMVAATGSATHGVSNPIFTSELLM